MLFFGQHKKKTLYFTLGINQVCIIYTHFIIMAFTRFYDDPLRISKRLEESTFAGRYQLDMPGPGVDMPFEEDPHARLQKWGHL